MIGVWGGRCLHISKNLPNGHEDVSSYMKESNICLLRGLEVMQDNLALGL